MHASHTIRFLVILVILASVISLAGCATQAEPTPGERADVKVAMGYIPNVQFTPFYVAQEKGYFTDEGLNVTFDYGMETDLIKLLAADQIQFVVGSGDQVVLARSQGLPIVYVLQWYRQFPVSVVALDESGITSPADLVGKTVGTPVMYGASYVGWKALVYGAGLPEAEISLQAVGYGQLASLLEGRIDAAVCYVVNEPVQLRQSGHSISEFLVSDYVDLVSNGLITNEKSIDTRSETVAALVRALVRGIEDTVADPDAAFEVALKHVPEAGGDNAAAQKAVLNRSVELWRADQIGLSSRDGWATSQAFMLTVGLIDQETDIDKMFTNRFVTDAP
jgi:NitT/TauT family transport system substrate-binding protein